jgi:hypothetical protein
MYTDGMSFLEDEREAWRPYEALDALSDEQLSVAVDGAHGWRGRDLMGHMTAWQEVALAMARDLAVRETSASKAQADADWEARGGDALNDELLAAWSALPMDELRRRFRSVSGELRGYLTVVPETRWIKHPTHMEDFIGETLEHYEDHLADLRAILDAAG